MIDDRTINLNLPKPNALNLLADDVGRLRTALDGIDTAVSGKAAAVHGHAIADVTGLQTALDGKQASLGFTAENAANKGAANGYAGLDGGGKVPSAQLPSYVDDVVEAANYAALPATGETGKIYVLLTPYTSGGVTSAQFRWTGSAYAPIVSSPGTTDAVTEGSTNLYFTSARALAAVPVASASVAGKVKVGSGINVAGDGTISVDGAGQTFEDVLLTATSNGQTAFTTTYTVGAIDVYLNGVKLVGGGDDFTATTGTGITLTVGISTTDVLVMRRWSTFLVANAATLGGVETLQNKTLQDPKLTLGGTNGTAGQVPVSQGAGLAPVWGTVGSELIRFARTSNTALTNANKSDLIDITSGTFTQTFDACTSLGDGWFCYIRNSGTGDITLDPNASETIDGLTSFVMYPGEVRLVQCDGTALRSVVLNAFYKEFLSSATFVNPPGYEGFDFVLIGGGGGGGGGGGAGSGNSNSTPAAGGSGGGGAAGSSAEQIAFAISQSQVPSTVTITVGASGAGGAGGTGGAGVIGSLNGNHGTIGTNGSAGGNSSVVLGSFTFTALGGSGGAGGNFGARGSGAPGAAGVASSSTASIGTSTTRFLNTTSVAGVGGNAGSAGNASTNGGAGGATVAYSAVFTSVLSGGTGGTSASRNGLVGSSATTFVYSYGLAGSGGGGGCGTPGVTNSNTSLKAGDGGTGGAGGQGIVAISGKN